MTYFHVTGKVHFDVDTDPDEEESTWSALSWEREIVVVDGTYFGGSEGEAIDNAIGDAGDKAKARHRHSGDAEYDSDTLIAIPETPEETDHRERLAAYTFMVRSGVPRLLEMTVA